MGGTDSQKTGRIGPHAVENELAPEFVTGRFDPDLGEDLWAEFEGDEAAAQGSCPLRAHLQVKSSKTTASPTFCYDFEVKHIRRWAAQPLPIFVVGVTTEPAPAFYAKSIDSIVAEDLAGRDPMKLDTETVRVHLPPVADLRALLKQEISAYYASMQLVLEGLPEEIIEQDHFELLRRNHPEPWENPPTATWSVLWKAPRRPQHFAAMLTELARRAHPIHSKTVPRPAFVVFHVYRSLFDLQHNLATARVDWVDPSHPKAPDVVRIIGAPGGFRMRKDEGVGPTRDFLRSRTATPEDYAPYAARVGQAFDALTDPLLLNPSPDVWDEPLRETFSHAETLWDSGPFAPVQHLALDQILRAHYAALHTHYFLSIHRRAELSPEMLSRQIEECRVRLADCRGAWRIFLRSR